VFVTLSAATVIIAASLVSELNVSLDGVGGGDSSYSVVVAKAMEVLECHRWQVEGAPEAKEQLERFLETVKEARKRRDEGKLFPSLFHSVSFIRLLMSAFTSCSEPDIERTVPR
jgi:hypothetical protein